MAPRLYPIENDPRIIVDEEREVLRFNSELFDELLVDNDIDPDLSRSNLRIFFVIEKTDSWGLEESPNKTFHGLDSETGAVQKGKIGITIGNDSPRSVNKSLLHETKHYIDLLQDSPWRDKNSQEATIWKRKMTRNLGLGTAALYAASASIPLLLGDSYYITPGIAGTTMAAYAAYNQLDHLEYLSRPQEIAARKFARKMMHTKFRNIVSIEA